MTPGARVQAAIEILDDFLGGTPAEKALTGWARRSRFAGSKDRAAIRDHVFDALRHLRSFAAIGGASTGRGLMLGALRSRGQDPVDLFSGVGHAPDPVTADEVGRPFETEAEQFDIPEWLWPVFERSLGESAGEAAAALQSRAPVHLRVNLARTNMQEAVDALAREGISTAPHPACETALEVVEGARKVSQSQSYRDGLVELQDAASQAVVAALNLRPGMRVLDYCAGGGGKALAMAASGGFEVFAHDANPGRMRDLPDRARRAGARITILSTNDLEKLGPFDVVLTDAPCSGSGSWRRAPAGKWALTPEQLTQLPQTQLSILDAAAPLVCDGGVLAYATCSMLDVENRRVIDTFLSSHPEWQCTFSRLWQVVHGTDGFYSAHLTRR
ncbi:RsmB/NOP family class I SAM-dependent RNA methyltransferase [Ruegeria arenilitoris]|uniref:RsmB/NOP family class I SAM-dependent RNA methyltransferase n=1 Tax=Ruegeria arenilitoris TaxID=1173585 RepID=UPI00147E55BA|nr:RsmB/NOP family class I SAM-dependent RNA methyltransferase [Ruegeria arenilitoris]